MISRTCKKINLSTRSLRREWIFFFPSFNTFLFFSFSLFFFFPYYIRISQKSYRNIKRRFQRLVCRIDWLHNHNVVEKMLDQGFKDLSFKSVRMRKMVENVRIHSPFKKLKRTKMDNRWTLVYSFSFPFAKMLPTLVYIRYFFFLSFQSTKRTRKILSLLRGKCKNSVACDTSIEEEDFFLGFSFLLIKSGSCIPRNFFLILNIFSSSGTLVALLYIRY